MPAPLWTPNSLVFQANTNPIYVGQAFSPLVGYIDNTGALTQLTEGDITYRIFNNTNQRLTDLGNFVFVPNELGSYAIIIDYDTGSGILHGIFYFYVVNPIQRLGYNQIYTILKQELPSSYSNTVNTASGNYLDNYASAQTLAYMYQTLYNMADQQYPANQYNTNWEYALNGTNYLFLKARYPNLVANLLYQVPYNTGITRFDLTRFIAKYCYYYTGSAVTVYIDGENNITVYAPNQNITWILGDPEFSLLGQTTYLGSIQYNLFGYLLLTFLLRYFPVQIKWTLNFSSDNPLDILTFQGYTYYGDIRPIVAMAYQGDAGSPFNLLGYTLT